MIPRKSPNYLFALLLFLGPLCCYLFLIGRWSLSGDEIYTLRDSRKPLQELLAGNYKPIYYLICHFTIQLPLPLEFSLRLPAAIASALVAPTFYLLLWRPQAGRVAVYAALLIVANPWLFELSQFARFYSLMFWFASISALSLYRWLISNNHQWLILFFLAAILATFTHNSAITTIPAGILAATVAVAADERRELLSYLKGKGRLLLLCTTVIALIIGAVNYSLLVEWIKVHQGKRADYSFLSLVGATAYLSGLQLWALAFIPLIRLFRHWTRVEILLFAMIAGALLPYLILVPFDGGVAPRYLLASLPGLFVFAAMRWDEIAAHVSSFTLRFALGAGLLAAHVPFLASTLVDGNHHDYRRAVEFVESLELEDPIIASSSHGMYLHYASDGQQATELGNLISMNGGQMNENNFSWKVLSKLMKDADTTGCALVLVSLIDGHALDEETARWLGGRFTMLASIEKKRFDHRQHQLVIYQYRPHSN